MEWLLDPMNVITLKLFITFMGGFTIGFYYGMRYAEDNQ